MRIFWGIFLKAPSSEPSGHRSFRSFRFYPYEGWKVALQSTSRKSCRQRTTYRQIARTSNLTELRGLDTALFESKLQSGGATNRHFPDRRSLPWILFQALGLCREPALNWKLKTVPLQSSLFWPVWSSSFTQPFPREPFCLSFLVFWFFSSSFFSDFCSKYCPHPISFESLRSFLRIQIRYRSCLHRFDSSFRFINHSKDPYDTFSYKASTCPCTSPPMPIAHLPQFF